MYWHQALAEDAAILLSRRELLQFVGLISLAGCRDDAASNKAGSVNNAPTAAVPAVPWSNAVHLCLAAACEAMLPAGEVGAAGFPGAAQAGVIDYIARQVAKAPLSRLAPALIVFAAALDDFARGERAVSFAQAAPSVKQAAIGALATGTLAIKLPQRPLFTVLRSLTLEGLLADPSHGGNRDGVGWTAIGLPATAQVHHHEHPPAAP